MLLWCLHQEGEDAQRFFLDDWRRNRLGLKWKWKFGWFDLSCLGSFHVWTTQSSNWWSVNWLLSHHERRFNLPTTSNNCCESVIA